MSRATNAAASAKNLLLGDQFFTEQLTPNSSLFNFSEITQTHDETRFTADDVDQSFASCHSLSERLWLKSILAEWRKQHRQVRRDKQLFFAVRDFVIRRLTNKAFRAVKINYARTMLAKHIIHKQNKQEEKSVFRHWQSKLLIRIRIRMLFLKFVEYRGAKLLAIHCFKQYKHLTDKLQAVQDSQQKRQKTSIFRAIKHYSLTLCK